jgi:hypothetical protein
VPGRHVCAAGERLDVKRLCVLPVDPIADAAQPREVAQVLVRGGSAGHPCILSGGTVITPSVPSAGVDQWPADLGALPGPVRV